MLEASQVTALGFSTLRLGNMKDYLELESSTNGRATVRHGDHTAHERLTMVLPEKEVFLKKKEEEILGD